MKWEDFPRRREKAPGIPLLRPASGFFTSKLPITCRVQVQGYGKNHQLDALATLFVAQNPDKERTEKEKEEIQDKIRRLKPQVTNFLQSCSTPSADASGFTGPSPPACPVCGYGGYQSMPHTGSCAMHDICACCQRPVPAYVPQQSSENQVQCEICRRSFCALISPTGCPNCLNDCLTRLIDLRNMTALPSDLLLRNTVETSILKDHLATKGISVSDFVQSCLDNLDPNLFGPNGSTDQSLICHGCGLRCLSQMAYKQREAIPNDELPVTVTARPNCYYGRKCRTQRTNMSHAHRYNHICEQTRF
ncbi:unnamed protein product [Echinostoma caproni]|uniref:C2H2-type domain-containing protein n=1 Tax=Echinostoma caproni TaxID=27848 RepID=A0A183A8V2_9TREM|nr:unnamed protein product [Echinostoma caproni]